MDGDAKVVMTTSTNGVRWTSPRAVSDPSAPGHQFMPSLAFAGGKLLLVYYDLRDDVSQTFSQFADDTSASPSGRRRTFDIRASLGTPGAAPSFAASVKVSDYPFGSPIGSLGIAQLQFNPPNLPMFGLGTLPFVGDYIDVTPAPAFVPDGRGGWQYNTTAGTTLPVFHAVWTDNRDVRRPLDGDWTRYTPPVSAFHGGVCDPGFVASRNQNIYTSRITGGLIVGSPGNSKPLTTAFQRAFVVFAQNTTDAVKTFRMTIASQPAGGGASFSQFTPAAQPLAAIDVTTAPRSLAARTVYATSSNASATIEVDVREITGVGGTIVTDGLQGTAYLNPDITNPDIVNPDITNPDITNPDITNAEVHNPDITNPDITNPDITNPDITNPDITNPDITNPDITNPDITNPDITNTVLLNPDIINPDITNPDITNPDITNPDITNPDITNPDIVNGAISDLTWTMQNNGNTTTAYNVNLFLAQQNIQGLKYQLILHKTYNTPVAVGCDLKEQRNRVLVANIPNPQFVSPTGTFVDQNDPSLTNPTLWLAPGEAGWITLRVVNPEKSGDTVIVNGVPVDSKIAQAVVATVTPVVVAQPVGTPEVALGQTEPPIVTPSNSSILFVQQPTSVNATQTMTPPVTLQVRDGYGVIAPGVSVTLTLGNDTTGATLSGGAATTDVNGVATFAGLTIDKLGTGYTLIATVTGGTGTFTPATSAPFDVNGVVVSVPGTAGGTENINQPGGAVNALGTVPVNTGVFVPAGQSVTVSASGTYSFGAPTGPDGDGGLADSQMLAPGLPRWSIIGRIGPGAPWQPVGSGPATLNAAASGFLELAINDNWYGDNGGALTAIVIPPAAGSTWIVTNANATGPGSLKAAIDAASAGVGPQGVAFDIPGAGPYVIHAPALTVTNSTYIDGSTEPGYAGTPLVLLDGSTPGATWNGIEMAAPDSAVRALVLANYAGRTAIDITANNARVFGAYIGTDATGTLAAPNDTGVKVAAASGVVIGGPLPSQQNVISGNSQQGIWIGNGTGHSVIGNHIGIDLWGTQAVANGIGILVDSGANAIGGPGVYDGNVISGNGVGILFRNSANGTVVQGNRIGTDPAATFAIANGEGVSSYFGPTGQVITGNTIAGNTVGISLQDGTSTTTITGNTVGLSGVGNTAAGIEMRSATVASPSIGATVSNNTIGGNGGAGVRMIGLHVAELGAPERDHRERRDRDRSQRRRTNAERPGRQRHRAEHAAELARARQRADERRHDGRHVLDRQPQPRVRGIHGGLLHDAGVWTGADMARQRLG